MSVDVIVSDFIETNLLLSGSVTVIGSDVYSTIEPLVVSRSTAIT